MTAPLPAPLQIDDTGRRRWLVPVERFDHTIVFAQISTCTPTCDGGHLAVDLFGPAPDPKDGVRTVDLGDLRHHRMMVVSPAEARRVAYALLAAAEAKDADLEVRRAAGIDGGGAS